jgi:hypothetical protein
LTQCQVVFTSTAFVGVAFYIGATGAVWQSRQLAAACGGSR